MFTDKEEMSEQLKLYFEGLDKLAENDQTYMEDKVGSVLEKDAVDLGDGLLEDDVAAVVHMQVLLRLYGTETE